jgi:hypothetical protein
MSTLPVLLMTDYWDSISGRGKVSLFHRFQPIMELTQTPVPGDKATEA